MADAAEIASVLTESFTEYESLYTAEAFAATTPSLDADRAPQLKANVGWFAFQSN